jgi:hypothetical protein
MPAIAGLRGTGDFGTDERPKNFREMILWLQPNGTAPITALMAKTKKESTDDPEFSWWEEVQSIVRVQLDDATDMNTTDTAVVVDAGALELVPGDLLLVETDIGTAYANEIVQVTAVTDDTNFTISRGAAGTTAANILDNTWFLRIGSAFSEGSGAPDVSTNNPTKFFNYCEIFKTAYEVTETLKKTKARTGDTLANDKKRAMFKHSTNLEQSLIFGKASETTGSNGKPLRTTGGLIEFLGAASRIYKYGAALTSLNDLLDQVYDVFDYTGDGSTGGDERLVFMGNAAANILNKLAQTDGTVNFGEVIKVYGMNFTKFVTPQGTFYMKTHPLMNRHPVYSSSMLVLDPPGLRYRPLRDTKSVPNIQANDADTEKGQWLTEAGFEFNHMQTMKFLHNLTI